MTYAQRMIDQIADDLLALDKVDRTTGAVMNTVSRLVQAGDPGAIRIAQTVSYALASAQHVIATAPNEAWELVEGRAVFYAGKTVVLMNGEALACRSLATGSWATTRRYTLDIDA